MRRRDFLGLAAAAPFVRLPRSGVMAPERPLVRAPLRMPAELRPNGQRLVAAAGPAEIAPGRRATVWTVSEGQPQASGPTIRVRTGETARLELENRLGEPTILHWHGLHVPEDADGHPRLAIAPGGTYAYEFPVLNRAGTYWYHAHPHMRTGEQVYRGMAGMLLVNDPDEDALGLPAGEREVCLLLHDRRLDAQGEFHFAPVMHERMEGYLGDTPFGNGIPDPALEVDSALYRLRVVNVTGARIVRLALSTGAPMTLIGVDGGLLAAPETVEYVDLGTGERADLLVDFSDLPVGTRVMLLSQAFSAPEGEMGMGMGRGMGRGMGMGRMGAGGEAQGAEMGLLEFTVARRVREPRWTPRPFPTIERLDPAGADRTREFRFSSTMMQHAINGREFDVERIDERVPFGSTEVWRFINNAPFPHPVHMHEVHFQVLGREGGRGRLFPWEAGWKDTVLVFPGEAVEVIAEFKRHRGLYLMHCHNLMHEDMGMMMNFAIE